MARHSSNRERIERMAQEAEVTRKEKAAADAGNKTSPAKKTTRKTARKTAAKATGRIKVVWQVCDQAGRTVKTYPYAEEQAARSEAERLTEDTGKTHFVTRGEEPLE